MGASALLGKALTAAATILTRTAKDKLTIEPSDILLTDVGTYYHVAADCGRCRRRTPLDMRRMLLRSNVRATLGGLRSRLQCKVCSSHRTSLSLSLSPRD